MASTRGRQVVVLLTNKSGGGVVAGDVVVLDSTNDTAFKTTTTAQAEVSVGIAQDTIANNGTGRVLVSGYAALVNVPASVTRGHYVETHTVAKQATGNATRRAGSFGTFLTGGTTPTALIWGDADQTASGGLADQGTATYLDFTTGSAPSSPASGKVRLYSLTGDHMYQKTSGGTATALDSAGGGSLSTVVQEISADYTVGSDSTFHDVTGMTGISVGAGTWLAFIDVELATGSSVGPAFRLTDGTTTYAQGNHTLLSPPATLSNHFVMHMKPTVLGSTTTFKLQVWSDVGCTIKKYPIRGSDTGVIATHITFLQIA